MLKKDYELSIFNMIHMDMHVSKKITYTIECPYSQSFHDLHELICRELHLDEKAPYCFYHSKLQMEIREIIRSSSISSSKRLLSVIQVGDELLYYHEENKYRLRVRGIGSFINEPNLELHLMRAQMRLYASHEKTVNLPKNKLSVDSRDMLYKVASNLYYDRIYDFFKSGTILIFHIDKQEHYVYIENNPNFHTLSFFKDKEYFYRFLCVRKDIPIQYEIDKYKHALSLSFRFAPLPEIPYMRMNNTYMSFQNYRRGYPPDQISDDDAKALFAYLQILFFTIRKLKIFPFHFDVASQCMHIYFDEKEKKTDLRIYPFSSPVMKAEKNYNIKNIPYLLKCETTQDIFELDYIFEVSKKQIHKHIHHPYKIHAMCANHTSQLSRTRIYTCEQDVKEVIQDLLYDLIEQKGRCKTIVVKERYLYSLTVLLCKKVGIQVKIRPSLPCIEERLYMKRRPDDIIRPYR